MNRLPPIQGVWIGNKLGPIQQISIKSFMAHGHPYHLYTYGKVENIPEGAEVKDGNEILSGEYIYKGMKCGYAAFADWFRWTLMQKKGGIYMDLDTLALRSMDIKGPVILCYERPNRSATGVLKIPSDHPLIGLILKRCTNPRGFFIKKLLVVYGRRIKSLIVHSKKNIVFRAGEIFKILLLLPLYILLACIPGLTKYGSKEYQRSFCDAESAGPFALEFNGRFSAVDKLKKSERETLKQAILPKHKFYPIGWWEMYKLFKVYDEEKDKEMETLFPDSYCLQFWNSVLDKNKLNNKVSPHSILGKAAAKYNVNLDD